MAAARFSPSYRGRRGASIYRVAGPARLSSAIAAALDDMCRDLERHEHRLQLARCIAAADRLIDELEGLSLAGETRVPAEWQARLDGFGQALPAGVSGRLRAGSETNRLLDEVFAIEERLFRLKLGEWARGYEGAAPGD
jgi:hypothetical protein